MIYGMEGNLLDTLRTSNHIYYLTGSRRYGGWHSESDWDFFVMSSPEVKAELDQLEPIYGLKSRADMLRDSAYDYGDKSLEGVYWFKCPTNGIVNIQLTKPGYWAQKMALHDCITNSRGMFALISKHDRKKWWLENMGMPVPQE